MGVSNNLQKHDRELPLVDLGATILKARCPAGDGIMLSVIHIVVAVGVTLWQLGFFSIHKSSSEKVVRETTCCLIIPAKNHNWPSAFLNLPVAIVNMECFRARDEVICYTLGLFLITMRLFQGAFPALSASLCHMISRASRVVLLFLVSPFFTPLL